MSSFKSDQQKYPRVKKAYEEKYETLQEGLAEKNLNPKTIQLFVRAFKREEKLELWVRDKSENQFILFRQYDFCSTSGGLGPKRKQGDLQIPEGIYHIDRFNPMSKFHLSLGINYPNRSDKLLGSSRPGGDIFIHGNCVTIGCIPISDDKIKELYILAVEAKNNGQSHIPVHIYPFKMSKENWEIMETQYKDDTDLINFWRSLNPIYSSFEKTHKLEKISISDKGDYFLE